MIRYNSPFDGERFLLNISTKLIHDLDNESTMCDIDNISTENIQMLETENEVSESITYDECNGCYWCLPRYHRDLFL